jgi:hypothetical protein
MRWPVSLTSRSIWRSSIPGAGCEVMAGLSLGTGVRAILVSSAMKPTDPYSPPAHRSPTTAAAKCSRRSAIEQGFGRSRRTSCATPWRRTSCEPQEQVCSNSTAKAGGTGGRWSSDIATPSRITTGPRCRTYSPRPNRLWSAAFRAGQPPFIRRLKRGTSRSARRHCGIW